MMVIEKARNNRVQATPNYASCEFVRQGLGAPGAER